MKFTKWGIRAVCMLVVIYLFTLVKAITFPFSWREILTTPGQFLLSLVSIAAVTLVAFMLGRGVRSVKGSLEMIVLAYLSCIIVGGVLALLVLLHFPSAIQLNLFWLGNNWYDSWITVFIVGAPIMITFLII